MSPALEVQTTLTFYSWSGFKINPMEWKWSDNLKLHLMQVTFVHLQKRLITDDVAQTSLSFEAIGWIYLVRSKKLCIVYSEIHVNR